MPDCGLVFGPVLRRGVASRALRFGRVGVSDAAPTYQQAEDERCRHQPRSQRVGHLKTERAGSWGAFT